MSTIPKIGVSRKLKLIAVLTTAVLFVGVSLAVYYRKGPFYGILASVNLIPTPEGFTELYFVNPSALPHSVVKKEPISFSFIVRNAEGVPTAYPYLVYFEDANGNETVISKNTISLDNNASTTVNVSYTFAQTNQTGTVVIDLTSLNQQIDFILSANTQ